MTQVSIPIASAMPGMHLAADLLDDSGRVLVPAGTLLTEALVCSLMRREVVELPVEQRLDEDPAVVEARNERIAQSVARCFRLAGDAAGSHALREAILQFRMGRGE